jgi:hypothetical protein
VLDTIALQVVLSEAVGPAQRMGALFTCCFAGMAGLLALAGLAFWIWAIIDVATKEPAQDPNKIVWVLIVVLLHALGAILYILIRRPERIRKYGR